MKTIRDEFEGEFGFLRIQKDAIRFSDIERAAEWAMERCKEIAANIHNQSSCMECTDTMEVVKEIRTLMKGLKG